LGESSLGKYMLERWTFGTNRFSEKVMFWTLGPFILSLSLLWKVTSKRYFRGALSDGSRWSGEGSPARGTEGFNFSRLTYGFSFSRLTLTCGFSLGRMGDGDGSDLSSWMMDLITSTS